MIQIYQDNSVCHLMALYERFQPRCGVSNNFDLMHSHINARYPYINNTSKTDVAPWSYKWDGWIGWKSPGGGMYRAPYGANKQR